MGTQGVNFRPSDNADWRRYVACAGPYGPVTNMYPADGDTHGIEAAKSVCAACPVINECLTNAVDRGENQGVWGGTTPDERKSLRTVANRRARKGNGPSPYRELADGFVRNFLKGRKLMSELKPFDPEAACGTCRSGDTSYTYDPGNDEYEELILRQCNRCSHTWHEVPLDLWNQRKYRDAVRTQSDD